MDKRIQKMGYDYSTLSLMDRLSFLGTTGMGALRYAPVGDLEETGAGQLDLDWLAAQAELVQAESASADVDLLQAAQGGSGGVRPKVVVGFNPETGIVMMDRNQGLPAGFEPWIVKFRSEQDPKEIGSEEYAYSLMAKAAGVEMPPTQLFRGRSGVGYFGVRRFDRTADGPLHMHTLSGLLNADHRTPEVDYSALLKATRLLTRDERHVEVMVRRMVFSVLARNRDDHSKNHAFLIAADGTWSPSPAYDLTFSIGPGGDHNMAVSGEGRNPTTKHLVAEAVGAGLAPGRAQLIIDEVKVAIDGWRDHAAQAQLSEERTTEIAGFLL